MFDNKKENVLNSFSAVKISSNNENFSLEETSVDRIDLTQGKNIVVLCGNNTRHPMRAGNYGYNCLRWLNNPNLIESVSAYSIYYPKEQPLMSDFKIDPRFDYDALAKLLFEPTINQDGKTSSPQEIKQTLENLVFFGHSIGGFVMDRLMNSYSEMLQDNGFTQSQIEEIFRSIVFIGYSPYKLVEAPINEICIAPIYDSMGSTKLAYERLIKRNSAISSNENLDIIGTCKFRASNYSNFFKLYETAMNGEDTIYFLSENFLLATPNLLFDDGYVKEDHNLAGVINYKQVNPCKTNAGELTTQFIQEAFGYSFSKERDKFSLKELFQLAKKIKTGNGYPSTPIME